MRVGVIIPTRGKERWNFVKNALFLIGNQTRKPDVVDIVAFPPKDDNCDITERYRIAYQKMVDVDVIFFWEDDDFYHRDYIKVMLELWDKNGRPDLFGTTYTIYYHIKLLKYFRMYHYSRSSAMNTMIKPGLKLVWGKDDNPYTDVQLWNPAQRLKTKLIDPPFIHSVGIKHGVGKSGGHGHTTNLHRFNNDDPYMHLLHSWIDDDASFEFYKNLHDKLK